MLIDTHAHLNLEVFQKDLPYVLNRASQNDVKYFIVPGLEHKTNEKAVELAIKNPFIKAAVGIHPCYWCNEDPFSIEQYLSLPQVVAVGEIGIDLYHEKDSLDVQKKILQLQIQLALKYNLPIILHARSSFDETYEILKPYQYKIKGVFHCLTTHLREAQKAVELGFYVGIGGIVTYENSFEAHQIVKTIPLNKLFLETDSPFLTPFPIAKNKRNEPAFIKIIAEKIANLRNISLEEVALQTSQNAKKLFSLDF
ncbi:TatD family hydrolase [Candidatus Phytoplasma phoenicium]|uniref:Mg-dependent DNase n=1 Tax=Candidatus Phytoplasma phoenicium TaxID=198422 RepID=A0A0L0MK85_9MOLU|nr:TatD family hydrolase [Candidatus Phytoplasma phoenicium]KND62671.1 Mg-dependent DNase [Candidatus Phytoplasma phoenicium]